MNQSTKAEIKSREVFTIDVKQTITVVYIDDHRLRYLDREDHDHETDQNQETDQIEIGKGIDTKVRNLFRELFH
jgi:hypothetical protein